MKKGKIRVVVDTNWWVSFVINRFKSQLAEALMNPRLRFYSSAELDNEILETLDLPHLQKFVRPEIKVEFLALYPAVVVRCRYSTKSPFAAMRKTISCFPSPKMPKPTTSSPATKTCSYWTSLAKPES